MAQINLLKQKSQSQSLVRVLPSLLVKFFVLILLGILGFYVWMFLETRSLEKEMQKLNGQIIQARQDVAAEEGRSELITRQAQLKELEGLLGEHFYWSRLLPALSQVTLKKAKYSDLAILDRGEISLEVAVPTLEDIDKFLQVFDLPEFYKNFSDIRIGAFHKIPSEDEIVYAFNVIMNYNPGLIEYQRNNF
ncbi:MAG: hypothetical protein COT92_01335 [Candidatus Doudnabacteria bacterium CG10_big_fil_rev_8_21_14_0_10_42_18]|uniref:Uncharacterized protein n=1 Tax=Candidatus Doudnabacteria bacterium CG10_big_fil_rev_8_21_14_0_10_42_18 TaxID=1974552 RepID=A0A2H0VBF0_9BACT|nr:MAG: hypothetical protein COT92_01335 [Candidatus Doudnabacteria bacterium CG10_big_fil_rev_8_21_14_0_10_42_18]